MTDLPQGSAAIEPEAASAVTPMPQRRSRRLRWTVAIGVVAIVALITVAGVFVLSGAGGAAKSLTAGNAPKETLLFIDLRTDLPGDQHQKLADFMTHFPGFKDRAQFENAFDEVLNRITGQISPQFTYTSAFKAWTSGEISIAVTDTGTVSGLLSGATPKGVLIVSLKDRAAAEEWVTSEAAKTGLVFVESHYAGSTLHEAASGRDGVAYAFTDRVLIAGTADAVKAGLDAPIKGSLADSTDYVDAMKSLGGDRIAAFFLNPREILRSEADSLAEALGPLGDLADVSSLELSAIPSWVAGSVRAESDRIVVETRIPKTAASPTSGSRESELARRLPGSTVAVVEMHSIDDLATQVFEIFGGEGATEDQRRLVEQAVEALRTIGGVDWIGDAALVVTRTGAGYGGGLVVTTPDAETAAGKKAMFANMPVLARAALLAAGLSVSQSDWTYKGTSIARLTISDGSMSPITLDLAARDSLLIAGYGEEFMKDMLDTTERTSLAAQDGYRRVLGASGMSNSGFAYLNIEAVVHDIGRAAFSSDPAFYDLNYAPYLDNLSGLGCSVIDGQTVILRLVVMAK